MNILITGAGGFLGQHLINYLQKNINKDFSIYILGNKKIPNCKNYYLSDVCDEDQINMAISSINPDYLFHLAGTADNSLNFESIESVNTTYCFILLNSIIKNNLHNHTKIVIVGSSAEYGVVKPEELPISENQKSKPKTPYGITKYNQTINSLSLQKKCRKLVVVRPFNIIGKNMPKNLAIGNFFSQICSISNKGFIETGNLNVERDYIDVYDVVNIMWKLINNDKSYGEVINICTGKKLKLKKLVQLMIELCGREIKIKINQSRIRKKDINIHFGDNKKLLSLVGSYKFISWKESVKKIMKKI